MKFSGSATGSEDGTEPLVPFTCNICGLANRAPRSKLDREVGSCPGCGSTVRTRAVVQMIARELFGLDLTLPDFPVLKGVRGMGISDSPDYAEGLAAKFSYRNTFYHKEPKFDIVHPPEAEFGSYDFLIASEVFEHVAPPVEIAFENAFRLLKPGGLFFFTVPYTLDEHTAEHFEQLHDYGIAHLQGGAVLVNRTRGGQVQVFDNLVFHGGGGETLEIRRFTERALREQFAKAGFREVEIYGKNHPQFGVVRSENWSLPMTARKEPFLLSPQSVSETIEQSLARAKRFHGEAENLTAKVAEYDEWIAWAKAKLAEHKGELEQRTQWARDLEAQLNERTEWALSLEKDVALHLGLAERFQKEAGERAAWALELRKEAAELEDELRRLKASWWVRLGWLLRIAG